jgi:hypothetical protein
VAPASLSPSRSCWHPSPSTSPLLTSNLLRSHQRNVQFLHCQLRVVINWTLPVGYDPPM